METKSFTDVSKLINEVADLICFVEFRKNNSSKAINTFRVEFSFKILQIHELIVLLAN